MFVLIWFNFILCSHYNQCDFHFYADAIIMILIEVLFQKFKTNICAGADPAFFLVLAVLRLCSFWFGEERRNASNPISEFWLVTTYCEMGNLMHFLRSSRVTWDDLGSLVYTLVSGIAYLHEDIALEKPALAHRDLKSANILLRPGPSCLLADFGLAIELRHELNRTQMEESGQVSRLQSARFSKKV